MHFWTSVIVQGLYFMRSTSLVTSCQFMCIKLCAATVMPTRKVKEMLWSLCIISCGELHSGWLFVSVWYMCWIRLLQKFNFWTDIFMGSMLVTWTHHYFCLVINLGFISLVMWIPRITGTVCRKFYANPSGAIIWWRVLFIQYNKNCWTL